MKVRFFLGAPSCFISIFSSGVSCLVKKIGVKSLSVVENFLSVYGYFAATSQSSCSAVLVFCMKLFIAPVTELVYVLVLETKF